MFMLKSGQDLDDLAPMLDKISERWRYVHVCRARYGLPSSLQIAENEVVCMLNAYMGIRVHFGETSFERVQECLRSVGWQSWLFDFIEKYGDLRVKSWYLSLAPARSGECDLL